MVSSTIKPFSTRFLLSSFFASTSSICCPNSVDSFAWAAMFRHHEGMLLPITKNGCFRGDVGKSSFFLPEGHCCKMLSNPQYLMDWLENLTTYSNSRTQLWTKILLETKDFMIEKWGAKVIDDNQFGTKEVTCFYFIIKLQSRFES